MKPHHHRNALRLTLHGPFSLYRPGFLRRLRESGPLILAGSLVGGVIWFLKALFTTQS